MAVGRAACAIQKKDPHDFSKNWACLLALCIDLINTMNQPRTGIGI